MADYNDRMAQLKITRREWAAALGAATSAPAQVVSPDQTTDLVAVAAGDIRKAAAQLEEFKLPADAEPAFVFKP